MAGDSSTGSSLTGGEQIDAFVSFTPKPAHFTPYGGWERPTHRIKCKDVFTHFCQAVECRDPIRVTYRCLLIEDHSRHLGFLSQGTPLCLANLQSVSTQLCGST